MFDLVLKNVSVMRSAVFRTLILTNVRLCFDHVFNYVSNKCSTINRLCVRLGVEKRFGYAFGCV